MRRGRVAVPADTSRPPPPRARGDKEPCGGWPAERQCRQQFSSQQGEERQMDFNMSDRQREWLNRVQSFMHKHVRPAVPIYKQQDEAGERWKAIPILEELKK